MQRALLVMGLLAIAHPAMAQPATATGSQDAPRVVISAGASAQPTTGSFNDVVSFPYFAETASVTGAYEIADGIAFDVGMSVRAWRNLGVRVDVTRVMRDATSEVQGSFPHPFFFNRTRTGTWSHDSLDRTELAMHVSAALTVLRSPRLHVSVFGGPSLFNFKQAVVQSVEVVQTYPYDTIDARLVTGDVDGTAVGFNAGVDLGWYFTDNIGVGAVLRFTNGTKKGVRIGEGTPFDLDLGGFQGGGGIRLRF